MVSQQRDHFQPQYNFSAFGIGCLGQLGTLFEIGYFARVVAEGQRHKERMRRMTYEVF